MHPDRFCLGHRSTARAQHWTFPPSLPSYKPVYLYLDTRFVISFISIAVPLYLAVVAPLH